jgi:hypothetical protein
VGSQKIAGDSAGVGSQEPCWDGITAIQFYGGTGLNTFMVSTANFAGLTAANFLNWTNA